MIEHTQLEYEIAEEDYLNIVKSLKRRFDVSVEKKYYKTEEQIERRKLELAQLYVYHKIARSVINELSREVAEAYKRGVATGKKLSESQVDRTPIAHRSLLAQFGAPTLAKLITTDLQLYQLNPKTKSKEAKRRASIDRAKNDFPHLYQSA